MDLDGTLAIYDGWVTETHIGAPIPEMVDRVKTWLAAGVDVKIFTARVSIEDPDIRVEIAKAIGVWCVEHIGVLLVTFLDFHQLRAANLSRVQRWHPGFGFLEGSWSGGDWGNAMAGEAGEACNVVKKLRRAEEGLKGALDGATDELLAELAKELADMVTYGDLLAAYYGIDLGEAVRAKFNEISERQGFPERL